MRALKPHCMDAYPYVMSDPTKTKDDMEKWMTDNKVRFEAVYRNLN